MNYDRGSPVAEDGFFVRPQGDVRRDDSSVASSVGGDDQRKTWEISCRQAGMVSMAGSPVEMRSCRFEIRRFALGVLVDVHGMFPGAHPLHVQFSFSALRVFINHAGSHALALCVLDFHSNRFGG